MNRLSVCVTTYNRAPLLNRTLASLAAQTRHPDEIIVSDDCSSDETASVAEKWRPAFRKFIYRRNATNLYMPGNLNACITEATGDYIANLHDADVFDTTLLQKWEAALDRYPSAGFVFCGVSTGEGVATDDSVPRIVRLNRSTVLHCYRRRTVHLHDVEPFTPGREFFERHFLHATYSIVWGTAMARRDMYEKLLPFDSRFAWISDVDMWMRACRYFDVAYVREPLMHLDQSPTPQRKLDWSRAEANRLLHAENIARFYGDSPERLSTELRRNAWLFRRWYLQSVVALAARRQFAMAAAGIRLLLQPPQAPC